MKQTIKIESCVPKESKTGKKYYKLNNKYFLWEEVIWNELASNIGKSFSLEVDDTSNFPKIKAIYCQDNSPAIEVVNCTGKAKVEQSFDGHTIKKQLAEEFILKQDSPNSRTYGEEADGIKLYFDTAHHLQAQIDALMALGLMPADYSTKIDLTKNVATRDEQIAMNKVSLEKMNPGSQE